MDTKQTPGKRFGIDCAEAGKGCTLKLSGTYDEVLETGLLHAKSVHGFTGEDNKLRETIKGFIKEETITSVRPSVTSVYKAGFKPQGGSPPTRPGNA